MHTITTTPKKKDEPTMNTDELRKSLAKIAQGDFEEDQRLVDTLRDSASNDERRIILQETERAIKQIAGEPEDYYFRRWSKAEMWQIDDLVHVRNWALDLMVQPTPNEVRRLEQQNDVLLRRTLDLHYTKRQFEFLERKAKAWADDCDLEAELLFAGCKPDEWLRMDEDEYYGSDFGYMLNLQSALYNRKNSYNTIDSARSEMLDDGTSWAEGIFLRRPEFDHICICYALHSLCTHINYPIPDVLRMNNFLTEVTFRYEKESSFTMDAFAEIEKDKENGQQD